MERITDFLLDHWIIVFIIDAIMLFLIIGYCFEKYAMKKRKKKDTNYEAKSSENTPLPQMVTYNKIDSKKNINDNSNKDLNNKNYNEQYQSLDENKKSNSKIYDDINISTNKKEDELDEFEKIIPHKNIVDEMKDQFENLELKIDPIKDPKIDTILDTNIELPQINLTIDDNDAWK